MDAPLLHGRNVQINSMAIEHHRRSAQRERSVHLRIPSHPHGLVNRESNLLSRRSRRRTTIRNWVKKAWRLEGDRVQVQPHLLLRLRDLNRLHQELLKRQRNDGDEVGQSRRLRQNRPVLRHPLLPTQSSNKSRLADEAGLGQPPPRQKQKRIHQLRRISGRGLQRMTL